MRRCFLIPALALALNLLNAARADDLQSWHTVSLKWLDTEYVDLAGAAHFRITDDSSTFSLWRLGQKVSADPFPWLRAGLAYRYSESENAAGDWRHQHRTEFQLTPHLRLNDRINVSLRNRLELRWNEGVSERNERTRHRLQFNLATPELRPLRAVYFSDEVFHDFDRGEISENRFVPLGLRFRLHGKANFRVFYMLRSVRGGEHWRHDHILGTGLSFRL